MQNDQFSGLSSQNVVNLAIPTPEQGINYNHPLFLGPTDVSSLGIIFF